MENSSKFNWQKFLLIGLACGTFFYLIMKNCWGGSQPPGTIRSVERTQELAADSIRKQVVSLKSLFVLDSARQQFLIPIGQSDLEKEERGSFSRMENREPYSSGGGYGPSSNLLFYDGLQATVRPLFDSRVSIGHFEFLEKSTGQPVLIFLTDSDSNKDQILDGQDLQKVAVWLRGWNSPKVLGLAGKTVVSTVRTTQDYVIFNVGEDRDKDGQFESGREPMVFYRLNFKCPEPSCLELQQVVPDATMQAMQRILDGF